MNSNKLEKVWKQAFQKRTQTSYREPEIGNWTATLAASKLDFNKQGIETFVLDFTVHQDGEDINKRVWLSLDAESEVRINITMRTLYAMGIETEDPTKVEGLLKKAIGTDYKIRITKKNEYVNLQVLEPIAKAAPNKVKTPPVSAPAPVNQESEDDIELEIGMSVFYFENSDNSDESGIVATIKAIDEDAGVLTIETREQDKDGRPFSRTIDTDIAHIEINE